MFTKAIVRPPPPNFAEGLTTAELGVPDYAVALEQHEAYCAALEQCGLELISLAPDPNYPDSTFVEDTAILFEVKRSPGLAEKPDVDSAIHPLTRAVLTRPGASSRLGEIESMREVLVDHFSALLTIEAPGTLDGGDVCQAGDHFFIGISERTNEAGAQQLAVLLADVGYTSKLVDTLSAMKSVPGAVATGSLLHLKSGIASLDNSRLVMTHALIGRREFNGYEVVPVDLDEMYAANCIFVNDYVLVAAGYPVFEGKLRALGYQTISLEMSEFQKMDGGLSCLSLRC